MKKLLLIIALAIASCYQIDAQTITLVPDETYGKENDWDKIFDTYYDTVIGRPYGLRKQLIVFDDGKAIVSHATRYRYSLFDANGKFLKDITLYFAEKGKKPRNNQPVEGKLGDLYFTKANNTGDIYLFNDKGLIVKELKIKYQALEMLALDDHHIAIYGGTSWADKYRHFVSILDTETGKEKILCDAFQNTRGDLNKGYYIYTESKKNDMKGQWQIAKVNGKLIVSNPIDGLVRTYDFSGNKISEKLLDWEPQTLSVEEQIALQNARIKDLKDELPRVTDEREITLYNDLISYYENGIQHIKEPINMGWFTIAIKGNDENILFFGDAEESGKNTFHTYSVSKGQSFSEGSFQCEDYDLAITKKRFVCHGGFYYGVQVLKNCEGMPLRLVRFRAIME
ncbi:MAG: hypothetical protein IKZ55_00655 [Bacteroidales bacterium]|nr:hypothetical protein [Bacteroidales bacterium]